ncbi:MAG: hypothetical protein ACYDAY_03450 [Candidatus Dormibacteria bacterium]
MVVFTIRQVQDQQAQAARAAVDDYTSAIAPLAHDAGQLVETLVKPTFSDFASGQVTAPDFAADARGWARSLQQTRDDFHRRTPPDALARAASLFDQAFAAYVDAMKSFEVTAALPPDQQMASLVADGKRARAADQLFDQASAELQRVRRSVGLGATPSFPDPSPGVSPSP